ncbi:MAG: hypothetical protein M3128_09555 [Verrucomicrobiota bacterium]|nr:hypothetical protein [Verrucomicrobiota bacterium]
MRQVWLLFLVCGFFSVTDLSAEEARRAELVIPPKKPAADEPQRALPVTPADKKETAAAPKKEKPSVEIDLGSKKEPGPVAKKELSAPEKKENGSVAKKDLAQVEKKPISAVDKKEVSAPAKKEVIATAKKEVSTPEKKESSPVAKKDLAQVEKKPISAADKKEVTAPARKEANAAVKKEVSAGDKKEITPVAKKEVSATEKKENISVAKKDLAQVEKKPITAVDKKEITALAKKEVIAAVKKDVNAADKKEILPVVKKEVAQIEKKEVAATKVIAAADKKDSSSTAKKEFTFQDEKGKTVSAEVVDQYQNKRIVYPLAKVDHRVNAKLIHAASIAQDRARAHSKSACWHYVKNALLASGIISTYPKSVYAKQAGEELVRDYGFKKLPIHDPYKAPIGSVLVYGARRAAGHVELRTKTGFVSDFQNKKPSKRPLIGVYAKA